MAYTTPRTWTTDELITAAMFNEQVRDNAAYLKDVYDTLVAHDHDGVDAAQIPWANLPTLTTVTWIPGITAIYQLTTGVAALIEVGGWAQGSYGYPNAFVFPFTLPASWGGRTPHVTEIVFYGWTQSNLDYFDGVYLRRSDLDGTYTDDVAYTTDIGNGSSGDVNVTVYTGDLTLSNFPYHLVVTVGGGGTGSNRKIYGFKVTWTL